jgi:hypothetical protein
MDLVPTNGKRIAASLGLSIRLAVVAGVVIASSAAGAQGKPSADATLVPFCTSGTAHGEADGLGLYEVGGGLLSADLVDAKAAKSCLKATPANLILSIGQTALNLSGGVQYQDIAGPQRRVVATTIDPVLCESYYAGSDNLALTLTNANGDVQGTGNLLRGVLTMSYSVQSGGLVPSLAQAAFGPYIACASASTANPVLSVASPDRIFGARFENNVDLQVEYLDAQGARIDTMVQTVNTNSVYKVRVSNRGEATATGVRIREFVPKPAGSLTPSMNMGLGTCVRDADAGSCAAADGTLRQDVASLAPGASVTYTLNRRVNGSTAVPAASGALTSVAAFVDPSQGYDDNLRDNSRNLRIGLTVNGIPVANAQTLATAEDQAIAIVLTGSDPEGATLNFIAGNATHGTLSGTAPNVTFTPTPDYNGPASFSFTAGDGLATSTAATVTINIAAVNDAPRVAVQLPDITRAEGSLLDLHVGPSFADPEGDAYTLDATGLPPGVNFFPSSGTIGGQLSLSASGDYSITVTATETANPSLSASDTFVLTVSNTNQNPSIVTPFANRINNEGDLVAVGVAANFADADAGDTLAYSVTGGALPPGLALDPSSGLITGTLTATASSGSPYTVTINANDGNGGSVSGSFEWTVNPLNFAPVTVGTLIDRTGTVGSLLNIPGAAIRAGFSDPDGDTLEYSATGLPTGVAISPTDGTIIGVPASGTEGAASVVVTASDGDLSVTQSFTLTISTP